jgi:Cu/Ag efflux protein CusF
MLKRFMTIGFVVLLLGWGISAGELQAAGSSNSLNGTLYIVDVTGHTVTLKDANGTATILNVTRKSKIVRNKKKTTLSGLVLGDQVAAQFDTSNNAKQLAATGPVVSTVQGGVGSVVSTTGVVQIETGRTSKNAQTSSQTRVVRNGKIVSLKRLTLVDKVRAHLTPGSSAIAPTTGAEDAVDLQVEGPEQSDVSGTITGIDLVAKTVTITPEEDGAPITVNLTADTIIELEGELLGEGDLTGVPLTIEDLVEGLFVEVVYDSATFNAFRIEVEGENEEGYAEGPITAIDLVAGTVTIDCYGTPVTVIVNASTEIERNGAAATLADLQVGDEVMAEYNTVTMIAKEIEADTPESEPVPDPEPDPAPAGD